MNNTVDPITVIAYLRNLVRVFVEGVGNHSPLQADKERKAINDCCQLLLGRDPTPDEVRHFILRKALAIVDESNGPAELTSTDPEEETSPKFSVGDRVRVRPQADCFGGEYGHVLGGGSEDFVRVDIDGRVRRKGGTLLHSLVVLPVADLEPFDG